MSDMIDVPKLKRLTDGLNVYTLNGVNYNWDVIEQFLLGISGVIEDRGVELLSSEGVQDALNRWLAENEFKPKEAVATFAELPISAELKEIRGVIDENAVYVYDGSQWLKQSNINFDGLGEVNQKIETLDGNLNTRSVNVKYPIPPLMPAIGDGLNDDAPLINAIIANAPLGSTVLVPYGTFLTKSTVVIDKHIDFIMNGIIISDHEGTAIKISERGAGTTHMPNFELRVLKKNLNHAGNSIGVELYNTYHSRTTLPYVAGFTTNLKLNADNGKGTVYNQISLGQIKDGKINIHITSDNTTRGWSNQNNFYGGRLYYGSSPSRAGYTHIKIDGNDNELYKNNGNNFYGTSMEDNGKDGIYAIAVDCNGIFNNFHNMRTEGSMKWSFGQYSYRNSVLGGTYIYKNNIEDYGTFNMIVTQGAGSKFPVQSTDSTNEFIAGANGTVGAAFHGHGDTRVGLIAYNTQSNANAALEIRDYTGKVKKAAIRGNGIWDVNGDRKVAYGLYAAAPTSGTWKRGDISFITNPGVNGAIGYVCIDGDGTGLGTWRSFGGVASTLSDSNATDVATLKNEFNALLARLRAAGLMAT